MQTRSQSRNQVKKVIAVQNEKYNLFKKWLIIEFTEFQKPNLPVFQQIEILKKIYKKITKEILEYSLVLDRKLINSIYNKIPDLLRQIVASAAKNHENRDIYKLMVETIEVLKCAELKLKTLV
jgi:hypothetical protein